MPNRPQPRFPEPNTQPYWDAVKGGELQYQQCSDCNEVVFYPKLHCTNCGSSNLAWKTSSGQGEVYTFSVIRQNRNPAFADLGPRKDEILRVLRSMSGIMDLLNPIRNESSVAHPNKDLLDSPEAALVINTARTILQYLDMKLSACNVS